MIEGFTIENFGRFRGVHRFELKPTVYSVTAQRTDDQDASNWQGKSTLLDALSRFVLYGEHAWRTEDEMISRGEDRMQVCIATPWFTATRSRVRGKTTVFRYEPKDGEAHEGATADAALRRFLGMSYDDFRNVAFFQQKEIDRWIRCDPAERQRIVLGWFDLGPLIAAGESATRDVSRLVNDVSACEAEIERIRAAIVSYVQPHRRRDGMSAEEYQQACSDAVSEMTEQERQARTTLADLTSRVSRWEEDQVERRLAQSRHSQWLQQKEERDREEAELATLRERLTHTEKEASDLEGPDNLQKLQDALSDLRVVTQQMTDRRISAVRLLTSFDGQCPVSKGFACPAKTEIEARQEQHVEQADAARRDEEDARNRETAVKKIVDAEQLRLGSLRRALLRLTELRAKVEERQRTLSVALPEPTKPKPVDPCPVNESDLETARANHESALKELARAEQAEGRVKSLVMELVANRDLLVAKQAELAAGRVGTFILGRQGAQRRIVEGELRQITAQSNECLSRAQIDLVVRTSWARETQGLASVCDTCGNSFPSSTTVKRCTRCGEARGPKLQQKLLVELSDTSGAAIDLAGVAFQLGVGAWLRTRRGSCWQTAFIDEPFAALDRKNSRLLARFLASMLGPTYGYRQALVVAHNRGIMDSMPGNLTINSDGRWSSIEVRH